MNTHRRAVDAAFRCVRSSRI